MLEWSDYIDDAERNAKIQITEQWTVNGINAVIAIQVADAAGYGHSWVSALIFIGVWFGLVALWAWLSSQAASKSWSAEAYDRKVKAKGKEEEKRIRLVCAQMLSEAGVLITPRGA
jgi:hypothetical protein